VVQLLQSQIVQIGHNIIITAIFKKTILFLKIAVNNINEAIIRTNTIITRAYQFIKLYFIKCYNENIEFPIISIEFIKKFLIVYVLKIKEEELNNIIIMNFFHCMINHLNMKKYRKNIYHRYYHMLQYQ
jgi:hypothetical protein